MGVVVFIRSNQAGIYVRRCDRIWGFSTWLIQKNGRSVERRRANRFSRARNRQTAATIAAPSDQSLSEPPRRPVHVTGSVLTVTPD
jgi:hypothetical protein